MWEVLIEKNALKFLESLDTRRRENVKVSLRLLKRSPYPGECQGDVNEIKSSSRSAFRMRIGKYRAFYIVEMESRIVKITEIMTAEAAHKKYGRL